MRFWPRKVEPQFFVTCPLGDWMLITRTPEGADDAYRRHVASHAQDNPDDVVHPAYGFFRPRGGE